ncbi:hypothetical protein SS45_22245 [Enterobacter hormaechei subsp. steigerwaltii]|uniref:Uncharacterized protein n=2 Tax=Enterobacter cloacae complex TaxID=354276 RepID=A0ABD7L324_9ENTR|nr:Tellurite resistance protein KlaB [Enterobacter cloacae]EUM46680.1 hypothetical protein L361_04807 [Enterobacter sp. MGH 15]KDM57273.1 hypothetical protein AF34_00050 [Enterobacter hormaechei subsp. hoffmannii]KJI71008.1 hypothetical protein UO82_23775 [Enterobacter hormaechei]KJN38694.1 hypothetical protein SS45_22245 [Enterobacter hormaechei subsp. steigerwaltii]KJO77742.1 hypothetical protein SR98_17200 [Enterobacter hormaechei subsp. xiangfangensis]KSX33588.1 hypothetical protein APT85
MIYPFLCQSGAQILTHGKNLFFCFPELNSPFSLDFNNIANRLDKRILHLFKGAYINNQPLVCFHSFYCIAMQ